MEWLQTMDWLQLLRCFCTGGIICVIGQILIIIYVTLRTSRYGLDKTIS